jgi:hypothetical protein
MASVLPERRCVMESVLVLAVHVPTPDARRAASLSAAALVLLPLRRQQAQVPSSNMVHPSMQVSVYCTTLRPVGYRKST